MTEPTERPVASRTSTIAGALVDLGFMTGGGLTTFGAWEIYHPVGFIVAGAFFLAGAWQSASKGV